MCYKEEKKNEEEDMWQVVINGAYLETQKVESILATISNHTITAMYNKRPNKYKTHQLKCQINYLKPTQHLQLNNYISH